MKDARCRSCSARILWTETMTGKKMPVDREPKVGGNLVLFEAPDDGRLIACAPADLPGGVEADDVRYTSHFATCPNATAHRKSKP